MRGFLCGLLDWIASLAVGYALVLGGWLVCTEAVTLGEWESTGALVAFLIPPAGAFVLGFAGRAGRAPGALPC